MGFMDKVTTQAKDLKGKVEDKVDEVQGKRKVSDLLEDLGKFVYAERTGRPIPGAAADTDRIVNELQRLENEGLPVLHT